MVHKYMEVIKSSTEFGDQRSMHIQMTTNRRRLKRVGRRKKSSTKPIMHRAIHIFNTGTLNDYTHPKEIDPYWGILYKQYEFLIYVELMYINSIKQSCYAFNDKEIYSIINDIHIIKTCKKCLLGYLMNFMNIMYGSVLQRRFYGWKYYIDEFISKFNEVAIMNLTRLKFDVDQTRCSVYFYQAFWLSGLSITTKIMDDLKKNESNNNEFYNNGIPLQNQDDDFDEIYNIFGSEAIDIYNTIDSTKCTSYNTDTLNEKENEVVDNTLLVLESVTESHAIDKHVEANNTQGVEEIDFELNCTLNKLLYQAGSHCTDIHNLSDKQINSIGKIIKKKISSGEIVLNTSDKKLLSMMFSSSLLF